MESPSQEKPEAGVEGDGLLLGGGGRWRAQSPLGANLKSIRIIIRVIDGITHAFVVVTFGKNQPFFRQ